MTAPTISEYLKFINLQMAAESLFGFNAYTAKGSLIPGKPSTEPLTTERLTTGNLHASKFTATEAAKFVADWELVEHKSNTTTGFSGTLFKNKTTNEYVISFRSTEFLDDAARDNQATNTLEIKEKGWAFGQIDDMEVWYKHLIDGSNGPKLIPEGAKFSVTGYSLGGHLATAFNLLRQEDGTQSRVDKVVTFNGAGVGNITQGTLGSVMTYFHGLRTTPASIDAEIADVALRTVVGLIRSNLKDGVWTIAQAKSAVHAMNAGMQNPGLRPDQLVVWNALDRMQKIVTEATDAPKLPSGSADPTVPANPASIPVSQIEQAQFDYQMAVLLTGQKTNAFGLVDGLIQAYTESQIAPNRMANQFDVQGATNPSAVSNSQLHYGTSVRLFVEDQPLKRGDYISEVLSRSLSYLDIKLLIQNYSSNDFGDTHSLVLLVDSLSVQNTLLQLLPLAQRADAGATLPSSKGVVGTLQSILESASNLVAKFNSGQGKAEGDVLENTLNALANMVLGPGKFTRLKGSAEGGTWADIGDDNTGRTQYYKLLKQVTDALGPFEGKFTIEAPGSANLAASARNDFGAFAALYSLSPFVLKLTDASQAEAIFGTVWETIFADWNADKAAVSADDAQSAKSFTDQWLSDRAGLLERRDYYNQANASYDSSRPDAYGGKDQQGNAINNRYDREDIVWEDRQSGTKILRKTGDVTTTGKTRYVVFGSDTGDSGTDSLTGGANEDHLYGGAGNDTLDGKAGDDCLEGNADNDTLDGGANNDTLLGGSGDDTYVIGANSGNDTILDSDGLGSIVLDGRTLTGSGTLQAGPSTGQTFTRWVDNSNPAQSITYHLDGAKTLTITGAGSTVIVKNFVSGHLGITAHQTPAPTAPVPPQTTYSLLTEADLNTFALANTPASTADLWIQNASTGFNFSGVPSNPTRYSLGEVRTGSGADVIEGGPVSAVSNTLLPTGVGNDRIYTGLTVTLADAIARGDQSTGIVVPDTSRVVMDGGDTADVSENHIAIKLIVTRQINTWATGRFDCHIAKNHRKNGLAGCRANNMGELHA